MSSNIKVERICDWCSKQFTAQTTPDTYTKEENWLIEELGKLILFLKDLCTTHRIQHFAIAFSKDSSACRLRSKNPDHPATVKTADVTCIRLY